MKTKKLNILNGLSMSALALAFLLLFNFNTSNAQSFWTPDIPNSSIYHLRYKVGIGTKSPSTRLMVLAPEKEDIFRLDNEKETVMFVKNNGKVGIGTTTQDCRLNIRSSEREHPLRVTVDGNTSVFAHKNQGLTVGSGARPPKGGLKVAEGGTVLFGQDTLNVGSKVMWIPSKSAFRGGEVIQVAGIGADVWNPVNIGEHSFAYGLGPSAKGRRSVSMGNFSNAEGDNSVALSAGRAYGTYSIALGQHPVAEGEASVALGKSTKANGNYSFATGYFSEANGLRSTALGSNTKAIANYSTAMGKYNVGLDDGLFEVGIGTSIQRENAFTIFNDGTIGMGTTYIPPSYMLAVDGGIICEKVRVELSQNWPDYVFKNNYDLPSLAEVQKHIDDHGHLPGIPAAQEVEQSGLDLGDMQVKMMEKIEELTLYILQQEQRIKSQEQRIESLETELNK